MDFMLGDLVNSIIDLLNSCYFDISPGKGQACQYISDPPTFWHYHFFFTANFPLEVWAKFLSVCTVESFHPHKVFISRRLKLLISKLARYEKNWSNIRKISLQPKTVLLLYLIFNTNSFNASLTENSPLPIYYRSSKSSVRYIWSNFTTISWKYICI